LREAPCRRLQSLLGRINDHDREIDQTPQEIEERTSLASHLQESVLGAHARLYATWFALWPSGALCETAVLALFSRRAST
jgi:hypothetical protein